MPTHARGSTLDLLLSTSSNTIDNIMIDENSLCKSDHYLITFDLKIKIKRKKSPKRKCFDFKRADWNNLNNEISSAHWHSILDNNEPDESWKNFATSLMYMIESNIPKINVKSEFCPLGLNQNATLNAKKKIGSEKSINTLKI